MKRGRKPKRKPSGRYKGKQVERKPWYIRLTRRYSANHQGLFVGGTYLDYVY